jgi:competence protein ComEA
MQIYTRMAHCLSHWKTVRQPAITGVATLLLMLGPGSALVSLPIRAQEVAQTVQATSININTASAEVLADGLNGIGLARAQDIVRHREAYGPFIAVDELAEVKGIGKATIDKNRQVITLE